MANKESKGMRSGLHYVVEFLVILLGITVSVTLEKNNAREYKREVKDQGCLLYTSPSPRDLSTSRMPSSA